MNPEMVLLFFFFYRVGRCCRGPPIWKFVEFFFVATNTANFTLQRIQTGSESMQLSPP